MSNSSPSIPGRFLSTIRSLFVSDAKEGLLLMAVAVAALVAANSPWAELYTGIFNDKLAWTPIPKLDTLHLWINDAVMVVFFFVVGLEVKRELISGNLADPRQRNLPIIAAIAGMAAPALVYVFLTGGDAALARGWAIPAATDIAFAMGVIGLLGSRVPSDLRLFLLTVAIVDDIGAVMIIAMFFTANIKMVWIVASLVVVAGMIAMNRFGVRRLLPFVLAAIVLWYCVLNSGVHATIAGVVAALTIPIGQGENGNMLEKLEHALVPWNAYLVIPIFGFANAGVNLADIGLKAFLDPLPIAIAAGLVVGKQVGIFSSVWIADKLNIANKPVGCSWREVWGVSILCGIGFTMSLFIGELAFPGNRLLIEEAKLGILTGSLISGVLGYIVLRFTTEHPEETKTAFD